MFIETFYCSIEFLKALDSYYFILSTALFGVDHFTLLTLFMISESFFS